MEVLPSRVILHWLSSDCISESLTRCFMMLDYGQTATACSISLANIKSRRYLLDLPFDMKQSHNSV